MPPPFIPIIAIKNENEEDLELTGSPLHTSLDDSLINQPLSQFHPKVDEYYNHFPLTFKDAMQVINGFTTSGNPTFTEKELPIWVLCDAADIENTPLMFIWRESTGWITRGKASFVSSIPCNREGYPTLEAMLKIHLQIARATKPEVSYLVKACYLLNERTFTGKFDEFYGNGSKMKIHFTWKRPYTYFHMPPVDASSTLEMTVAVGCEGALLWQEIKMLEEICQSMEGSAEERETMLLMSMTTMNITNLVSSLRGKIHSYICNGKLPEKMDCPLPSRTHQNGILNIHQAYTDVVEGRRPNIDLTEVLWTILQGCNDLTELNSCFKLLFREAAAGRFEPTILSDNKTTVAKVIQGLATGNILKTMPPRLKGNESLRMLFELGHLKLQRDYKYIFQNIELNAAQLDQVCHRLKNETLFKTEQRKECMENLMNIHSLTEVLMLLKSHLHLDEESLAVTSTSAISTLLSSGELPLNSPKTYPDESCFLGTDIQKTITLSLPIHPKLTVSLVKGSAPISWNVYLSTNKEKRKVQTIFHESSDEIFPTAVLNKGNQSIDQSNENLENHMVQFTLISDHLFSKQSI